MKFNIDNILKILKKETKRDVDDPDIKHIAKYMHASSPLHWAVLKEMYINGELNYEPVRDKLTKYDIDQLYLKIDNAKNLTDLEKLDMIVGFMGILDGIYPYSDKIINNLSKVFNKELIDTIKSMKKV